jgi:SSS family solute:Na+ symporter
MLCNFIVIYILATLAIGLFVSKFIKNPEDFALAGKRMPVFITASALFATWFGSETIMGASSEFVQNGLLGVI